MSDCILKCENVSKSYVDVNNKVDVLCNLNLQVEKGIRLAIVGPSGSGKSTLLHLLGGLDLPSSGDIYINDKNWQNLSEKERCNERNHEL
jgi:ABC-type lipoprotein export system ATPase subunit